MKSCVLLVTIFTVCLLPLSVLYGQPPSLNSYQSSPATVYLDFDGHYVTGTSWNWSGNINARASGLSNHAIIEIFNRVAEDYRPFNLNITTDSVVYHAAPFDKRMRLIITPTYEWYGEAGGISYVGSFNWGNETPAWVFSGLLHYNQKFIAEACSHEIGHTLGLQHQSIYDENCNKLSEYDQGYGEGETSWAPIMGQPYSKNVTTWKTGPNSLGCNNIQNDLSIIAGSPNDFGFREDDHGDDATIATNTDFQGLGFWVSGVISTPDDRDAFKLKIDVAATLKLTAIPQNVGFENAGANIDLKIVLLDAQAKMIAEYDPASMLNVVSDTGLAPGIYYIIVSGTVKDKLPEYENVGMYNVYGNLAVALPMHNFILKSSLDKGNHLLSWSFTSDEKIRNIVVEGSEDGEHFKQLVTLGASARTFSYKPHDNTFYYRLKAVTELHERSYFSAISKVKPVNGRGVELLSNRVNAAITCVANSAHTYQLFDLGGRMLKSGSLVKGTNSIDMFNLPKGMILLRLSNGVETWIEKLIKQ